MLSFLSRKGRTHTSENVTSCSICLEGFRQPKILPCFHSFCKKCLTDYVQRTSRFRVFACPLCRKNTPVPINGITGFQDNFYIQSAPQLREESIMTCSQHPKEELKAFCKTCMRPVCINCVVKSHNGHTTVIVSEEAGAIRDSLQRELSKPIVNLHRTNIKSGVTKIEEELRRLKKAYEDAILNIRSSSRILQQEVIRISQNAEKIITEKFEDLRRVNETKLKECKRQFNSFSSLLPVAGLVLRKVTDIEMIANGQSILRSLSNQIGQSIPAVAYGPRVFFEKGIMDKPKLADMFGKSPYNFVLPPDTPTPIIKKRFHKSLEDLQKRPHVSPKSRERSESV